LARQAAALSYFAWYLARKRSKAASAAAPMVGFLDRVQIGFGFALERFRQIIQDVGGPTTQQRCCRVVGRTFLTAFQKPSAVAGRKLGIDRQPVPVPQLDQELVPGLLALPKPIIDRQQFLPAAGVGADQHHDASAFGLEPWRKLYAIGPHVDEALGRQIAPLLILPGCQSAWNGDPRLEWARLLKHGRGLVAEGRVQPPAVVDVVEKAGQIGSDILKGLVSHRVGRAVRRSGRARGRRGDLSTSGQPPRRGTPG